MGPIISLQVNRWRRYPRLNCWQVGQGPTPAIDTGPEVDHTLGTAAGTYVHLAPDTVVGWEAADLLSPCFDLTGLSVHADREELLAWAGRAPERPDVWEISRFAIDPQWRDYDSLGAVGSVVGQMLLDLFDFSQANGITRIVAASDIRFDRILTRAGLTTTHYGPAVRMENSRAVAGWAEITPENRQTIEARLAGAPIADIPASIISPPTIEPEKRING